MNPEERMLLTGNFGLNFLLNSMGQQIDLSSLAALNPPQAKRKAQRKSGKSSPNHQPITKAPPTSLDSLSAVFGNKVEEIKTVESQQSAADLATANFINSFLGNTMSTPQM